MWAEALEHALASSPATAFPNASRSWTHLPASPLDTSPDRSVILAYPRAWLTISLQVSKPAAGGVLKVLISGGILDACLPVLRTALEPASDGQPVPPPCLKVNVGLLLKYCVQQSGDGAHTRVARCIVCALTRRLSLDTARNAPVVKLVADGLGAAKKRGGLVFLEPLRRLCLLAAARRAHAAPPAADVGPNALLQWIELIASADTTAPDFRRLPSTIFDDLLPSAFAQRVPTDGPHLPSALRTRLAPLLTADGDTGGGRYPWAPAPDAYLLSPPVHGALTRALHGSGALPPTAFIEHARDDVLRAASDDAGELLCACVALVHEALEPAGSGAGASGAGGSEAGGSGASGGQAAGGRLDARGHAVDAMNTDQRCDAADERAAAADERAAAADERAAAADERAAAATQLLVAVLAAGALPRATWRIALDELLRLSLERERLLIDGGGIHPHALATERVRGSRLLWEVLPSEAAEAAAITHWWPAVCSELRQRRAHSPCLDALLRRAGRLVCAGMELHATARPTKRKHLEPLAIRLEDAHALVDTSLLYLPACLPLLRGENEALTLVQSLALSSINVNGASDPIPTNVTAALHAASTGGGAPPRAQCGLALLPLWYAPSERLDVFSAAAVRQSLDVSAADLLISASSTELLRALYLPRADAASHATRLERAELLHSLCTEWMERGACEIGPEASMRIDMIGSLADTPLPCALEAAIAEAEGNEEAEVCAALGRLEALVPGMLALEEALHGPRSSSADVQAGLALDTDADGNKARLTDVARVLVKEWSGFSKGK